MLMTSSPRQDYGLACGVDSGEYVFMNTRVYLDRSTEFDEISDSPNLRMGMILMGLLRGGMGEVGEVGIKGLRSLLGCWLIRFRSLVRFMGRLRVVRGSI